MNDHSQFGHRNEVHLVGRVAAAATEKELPSGDVLVSLRVVVRRMPRTGVAVRQPVDTLECVAWLSGPRRALLRLEPGDVVELTGALRRRFLRGVGGGPVSRYEVEVQTAKRIARASQLSA